MTKAKAAATVPVYEPSHDLPDDVSEFLVEATEVIIQSGVEMHTTLESVMKATERLFIDDPEVSVICVYKLFKVFKKTGAFEQIYGDKA